MHRLHHRCVDRGIATLELVMALPVILTLLVALVWLGFAVIGQAEVTVEARYKAWSQRFEPWSQSTFAFSADQQASGDATTAVEVSPLLDGFGDPQSQHTIEQANWDHRSVEFRAVPNWKLYAEVGLASKREGLIARYEDARSTVDQLQNIGVDALQSALEDLASDLFRSGSRLEFDLQREEQQTQLEGELEEQKRLGRIRSLENEIELQKANVDRLSAEDESEGQARLWIAEQKLKRLEVMLKLVKS